ncbi:MAG: tyrosine/phenylalanine carboxypeptidase domain-containing protein, partial [Pseudomonadota bacterium]
MQSSERITRICEILQQATRHTRVLSHLAWDGAVREAFFANGALALPEVTYPTFDDAAVREALSAARQLMQSSSIDRWLERQAVAIEHSADMLLSCGTQDFYRHSSALYGAPGDYLIDQRSTALTLASDFEDALAQLDGLNSRYLIEESVSSEQLAAQIELAVVEKFGDDAPQVQLVDELSANALAGRERIRVRRGAKFNDKDIDQLIHHEAGVHVATSLNGMYQSDLPILGSSHAGTTRTQEGIAVFSEFITGSMDLERLRRLSDRTLAIQMAADGADFLEVYQYFLERTDSQNQSFENARRVFRGGVLTGGAPFTKDIV